VNVRIRQIVDSISHRLSFIPLLYVVAAIALSQLMLLFDQLIQDWNLPDYLLTTVDSARSVFTALAGALITSITLVLSMMLITVQLASSQFSPRTLRDWMGNRTLQHTIGLVLGTAVFCLLALRSTRSFESDDTEAIVPHATVLIGVALGIASLIFVVRSVDHITNSLRIGSVAERISMETIAVIQRQDQLEPGQDPTTMPAGWAVPSAAQSAQIPGDAAAIETTRGGWVQQIDLQAIVDALPEGAEAHVAAELGGFVPDHSPLLWISPPLEEDDPGRARLGAAFALGDTRTMQQDIAFGIVQLTDIAVRALSPGVNDPSTASDIVVHLGNVMLALWERPAAPRQRVIDGRTVVRAEPSHGDHLQRAFGPIRRYGGNDPEVMATMLRTLEMLQSEATRRHLAGPIEPIAAMIDDVADLHDESGWSSDEQQRVDSAAVNPRGCNG
jgi:uncharacterized membrane protein